eukprot:CAMPEP_0171179356 /NCGR_PEP_ID=MMETSP0790-20130122/13215_1 /TAXON_ID=2925 /ORGANISM="Alexandrium catenella, Strain OF101" /LENGTH=82 /DNA_ID=CAMNT_0011644287 /DNA_START=29 /DNA_END=274 /DNA_ORIENTATION=-
MCLWSPGARSLLAAANADHGGPDAGQNDVNALPLDDHVRRMPVPARLEGHGHAGVEDSLEIPRHVRVHLAVPLAPARPEPLL